MFQITTETCRAFTFAEVLIMAAINLESDRLSSQGCIRAAGAAAQSKHTRHVVPTGVPKAPQL
jgi:hypothetical protein